jgi:8-oxo-dGTP pyrophosphatase MutT (NUDIX family)
MPHIHTNPGEHDMTVSAYIVRMQDDVPMVLVHMHRKFQKLMQCGGHIELNESPWASIAHELTEETGYRLNELSVLQPTAKSIPLSSAVVHPVPVSMNTHRVNGDHLHSDLVYAFVANAAPHSAPAEGESQDIRWLSIDDLRAEVANGNALEDVFQIYETIITSYLEAYEWVPASDFELDDPVANTVSDANKV